MRGVESQSEYPSATITRDVFAPCVSRGRRTRRDGASCRPTMERAFWAGDSRFQDETGSRSTRLERCEHRPPRETPASGCRVTRAGHLRPYRLAIVFRPMARLPPRRHIDFSAVRVAAELATQERRTELNWKWRQPGGRIASSRFRATMMSRWSRETMSRTRSLPLAAASSTNTFSLPRGEACRLATSSAVALSCSSS